MVLYSNINVGQRIEVLLDGKIYRGTVKFKGFIATRKGDWVGIELDDPVGEHSGLVQGRQYFQCKDKHGIFVRAGRVRFLSTSNRNLYDKYYTASPTSFIEDTLFFPSSKPDVSQPNHISPTYLRKAKSSLDGASFSSLFSRPKDYHLRHLVSSQIPAATSKPPPLAIYFVDAAFMTSPSIPQIHMPYSALKTQVRQGWQNAHYVRHMSVGTGRDSIKFSQWNDISE